MGERPIRLTVSDDLRRGRGSVFFRIWFALPFLIWLVLWLIAAFFVAIVNWVVTLIRGQSPDRLHGFLARLVRYSTHVYAYLNLGSQPLPSFDGKPGYPVDVEIDGPRRQNRWTVAFRAVLAFPVLVLIGVIDGRSGNFLAGALESRSNAGVRSIGLITVAAFLGWFVAMVKERMPRGLRDLIAYGLSYGAQASGYVLLLTDRYPSSDPLTALPALPTRADPVQLDVGDDLGRNRLTVFFRPLLALPHIVWLSLWGVVAFLAAIVNWVAILFRGNSPAPLHRFLGAYVRYQAHVISYLYLIGNPFPGFTGAEGKYPVDVHIETAKAQNRWTVFFRVILAVPALLLASVYATLMFTVGILGWFASLFTGRMPRGLRNAGALAVRYTAQTYAYLFMVTGSYPYSGPCMEARPAPGPLVVAPDAVA